MTIPLVSIIIPTYNRFEYLMNAIESIENQTYKNYEIILVNDASDDERYYNRNFGKKVKKIDLETNQKNVIGYNSNGHVRNLGIKIADGKYLAFLDDDDSWLPEKLELQVRAIESSEHKMSSTEGYIGKGKYNSEKNYQLYNKERFYKKISSKYKGTEFFKTGLLTTNRSFEYPEVWTYDFLKIHNCIILSSVMVERELMNFIGGFRPIPTAQDYGSDYDCLIGLLRITSSIYVDEPLVYYDEDHGDGRNWE